MSVAKKWRLRRGNCIKCKTPWAQSRESVSCVSCGYLPRQQNRKPWPKNSAKKAEPPAISSMRIRWSNMIQRCENSKNTSFKYYGDRGIKVCERWRDSFVNFLNDVGPCPAPGMSIDRINNNGNYEPGNIRWASRLQQNKNTRRKPIDLRGKQFGRLTVLSLDRSTNFSYWRCHCACGAERVVRRDKLVSGTIKGCGCLSIERGRTRARHSNGDFI